jgi:osmoprotectant transport system ATP-binding protein
VGEHADGEPLAEAMSLRDALSQFVLRRADRLPVVDASGRALGAIAFADLLLPRAP